MPPRSSDRSNPAAGAASDDETSVSTGAWLHDHRLVLVLVLFVAVGATLRFVGIGWGLPVRLHADEWVIVDGALDMARRNSFEPPYFARPDHLEMMVSNIAYLVYAHLLRGTSVEAVHAAEPGALLLISRIVTALAGTFMIVLAYFIGRRFSVRTGAIAALLLAIFPPFVEHSRFATPDVPLTLALMGVVLSSMRYLESRSWKEICLASAAVALSISIKYPGALAFAMVLAVLLVSVLRHRDWVRLPAHGALATFAVPAFLFLISPSLFTNFTAVLDALARESRDTHPGADGLGLWGNLGFYGSTFTRAAGLVLIGAAAWGLYECVRKRYLHALPLFLGVGYWAALSTLPLHWERWGLPMYITPLLLAAVGLDLALTARRAPSRGPLQRSWTTPLATALTALSAVNLLLASMVLVTRYLLPDTRVVGMSEFPLAGINRSNSIFEGYTPLQPDSPRTVFDAFEVREGRLALREDLATTRHVVLSSYMYDRFWADESRYADQQEFYRLLRRTWGPPRTYEPLAARTPSPLEPVNIVRSADYLIDAARLPRAFGGPTIKVYDVTRAETGA